MLDRSFVNSVRLDLDFFFLSKTKFKINNELLLFVFRKINIFLCIKVKNGERESSFFPLKHENY